MPSDVSVLDFPSPKIVVLGSINMDLVVRCQELPAPGETILAESCSEFCGGKGANQAVAAALAGGTVSLIGAVGDDAFSTRLIDGLLDHKIGCATVARRENQASGMAIISVDSHGQNSIMVVPGANSTVTPDHVRAAESILQAADCLMVQLEVPTESILEGIRLARLYGVRVILDPAPAPVELPPSLLDVDLICPNETEAASLTGMPVESVEDATAAAVRLHEMGAKQVAITLGAKGVLLHQDGRSLLVPPFWGDPIDTTAAGDAFAGALAVYWSQSGNLMDAVEFANAAGALAASRHGAQSSIAAREEILELWKSKT